MLLEKGKTYETYGGWNAEIIWKGKQGNVYFAIHKPNTDNESQPVCHNEKGKALTAFSVGEPPIYSEHHPADIKVIGE